MAALTAWADIPSPISAPPASAVAPPEIGAAAAALAPPAAAPSNQIWECTTNGLRTFSSNPCGAKSTVRQLNPINVMQPPPVYPVTRRYSPPAAPTPVRSNYNPPYNAPVSDNPDETYGDNAYNSNPAYSGYPAYVVVTRAHHAHPHDAHNRPHPHHP